MHAQRNAQARFGGLFYGTVGAAGSDVGKTDFVLCEI